ncbi:MAG: PocR ligand-binding domain-containing protein [Bacteroidetes bacterium]|nr:PocR ligand-binding domain-containing protein [Bacteroidota bacterium]
MALYDQDTTQLTESRYAIENLVDLGQLQELFTQFTKATGYTIGFLDHPGMNILISTGWRDICTKFHRSCPISEEVCLKSNLHLLKQLDIPGKVMIESCGYGLVDCAMPIIIQGKHIASLATGQLLFKAPDIEWFKQQACIYGFNEKEYLKALEEVPVVDEDKLRVVTGFLGNMAQVISQMGYTRLKIIEDAEQMEAEVAVRKRAEEALHESEERYRIIAENTADTIAIYDLNLNPVFVSPSVLKLRGYSVQETTAQSLDQILSPDSIQKVKDALIDRMALEASGKGVMLKNELIELEVYRKNGSVIWVELAASFLRDKKFKPTGILTVTRNITERKRAAEKIKKLNIELEERVKIRTKELERVVKELESFSYSVSHDLRAPLRGIDGWSRILEENYSQVLDEQANIYLQRIHSETNKMAELINDLLKLSRISSSEIKFDDIDLTSLANSIVSLMQDIYKGRKMEFLIDPGLTAKGDKGLLETALTNLFDNACKFTGRNKQTRIEFSTIKENDRHIFFIRDNGTGFEMKYAKKLFGAFQRMHNSSEFPGTGIGLATVQRIIHRHNGRIWADAKPNEGATFFFTLSEEGKKNSRIG